MGGMLRRCLTMPLGAAIIFGMSMFATAVDADSQADAQSLVESLADEAVHALTEEDVTRGERIQRFRGLFTEHFAVNAIGKWVLGRNWRRATPEEREEYLTLFEDYIIAAYVDRFAQYTGEELRTVKTTSDGTTTNVFTEIFVPGTESKAIRVEWRIQDADGTPKIVDLVIEGVSMGTTLRSDFGSIIRRNGGNVSALLDMLREKAQELEKTG